MNRSFWLAVIKFQQVIRCFLSKHLQQKWPHHMKEYSKLCQKTVSYLAYHLVRGHLGVLKDMLYERQNIFISHKKGFIKIKWVVFANTAVNQNKQLELDHSHKRKCFVSAFSANSLMLLPFWHVYILSLLWWLSLNAI